MQVRKLPRSKVPAATSALLRKQKWRCPICNGSLRATAQKNPVLDHCHKTGFIRDVLCRNCNGMEGKVLRIATRSKHELESEREWLLNLLAYWERHQTPKHGSVLHHTHKTEEEKRAARLKRRRQQRAAKQRG